MINERTYKTLHFRVYLLKMTIKPVVFATNHGICSLWQLWLGLQCSYVWNENHLSTTYCLNVIDIVIWQLYYYYLHNEKIYFARQQSEKKWHTAKWYVKRKKTGEEGAYDPEMHNVKTSPKAERWKPTGKPRLDFLFYSFLYAIFILTASGLPFSQMLMLPQLFFCCYPF